MALSKRIARNFFSLFLSNIIGQLFTLWAFVLIARVFGAEGFGKFSFAQVVSLHFLYLADFGLQTLGTRTLAQAKGEVTRHVRDITLLRFLLAVVCFVLLAGFALALPKPGDVKVLVFIFGLGLFPFAVLFEWVFLGLEKMEIVGLGRVLKGMVFAGLVVALADSPDRLNEAAAAYVAGFVVSAGVLIGVFLKKFGVPHTGSGRTLLLGTLGAAVPLAVGSLVAQVNFNFGTIALGLYLSDEEVGLYSAAYKIVVFLLAFAVVAAANAVFPLMAKAYKTSVGALDDSIRKLLRLFVLLAIPIGIGGTILAPKIMDLLYAAEYRQGTIVLQISIWIVVIAIYRVVFENALIASRSQRQYLAGYCAAGGVTLAGNLLLAPAFGMVTPAVVGIASELVLLIYFFRSCRYGRLSFLAKTTVWPLVAGAVMAGTLVVVPLNVFEGMGVGALVYGIVLLLFRAVSLDEIAATARHVFQQGG